MKQSAVEFLELMFLRILSFDSEEHRKKYKDVIRQAKEMEKQQIIDAGNSCAFKQRLHSDRINKMSMDELEQYNLEPSYTFGEEHYYQTFNK